jgi:hypothetical protein
MIHAARKRRQMAREMGTPGDYVSLNAAENGNNGAPNRKSRLVRYERIVFFSSKKKSINYFYLVMMKMMPVMIVVQKIHMLLVWIEIKHEQKVNVRRIEIDFWN